MKRLLILAAVGFIMGVAAAASAAISDPVGTEQGLISGTAAASGDVRIYRGVPYAAPPAGERRWKAPAPPLRWEGVRRADEFGARCMQGGFGGGGRRGGGAGREGGRQGGARQGGQGQQAAATPPALPPVSEDCLFLNIWTSAAAASARLPVLVFVHGAGLTGGSGAEARYDGEALARKGAVVVTINYRLGPFGWLAHPDLTRESGRNASGNYGLMDAVASLKWVQANIASFGGDPGRVLVFGESAGAFQVAALVASPEAKGLFQRAIAESGGWMGISMGRMTTRAEAEAAGAKMASAMGAASIAELRKKPAEDIQQEMRGAGMIVDGWYVPDQPSNIYLQGRQNAVDLLVGSNKDEGTFFGRPNNNAQTWSAGARERFGDLADTYLKLYPAATDEQAQASYLEAFSDEMYWHMRIWAEAHAKLGKKAYLYYFTRVPPSASGQASRGATHTAELAYVFDVPNPGRPWEDIDKRLADRMTSYWVNFAASGNPNGPGLPVWPAVRDRPTGRGMILGDTVAPEPAPNAAKLSLFDAAFARLQARQTN
ncbi:MAG: carboxylesterase family protein [Gemmatimonadetes bacterium]|nr:carboxylesterase family protein [Gemmatimonadota bacterium]